LGGGTASQKNHPQHPETTKKQVALSLNCWYQCTIKGGREGKQDIVTHNVTITGLPGVLFCCEDLKTWTTPIVRASREIACSCREYFI
jgi:hypothetical protein